MTMERFSHHPDNQDPAKQLAIEQAKKILRDAGVKDPGPSSVEIAPDGRLILRAEYPLKPNAADKIFQLIWDIHGARVGKHFRVSHCPYTEEELRELESHGIRVSYAPHESTGPDSRQMLRRMFWEFDSHAEESDSIDDGSYSGWFKYDAAINSTNLGTSEHELLAIAQKEKRELLSLNQYMIVGQDSKVFTGHYPDEGRTSTRLASRGSGLLVSAGFYPNGRLHVDWGLSPAYRNRSLGGRLYSAR